MHGVPYYTTVQAARMAVGALAALLTKDISVQPIQEYLRDVGPERRK
jgi:carbamoyl-phosphate synthase large subunit